MIKPIGQTAVVKIADNHTVIVGNVLQKVAPVAKYLLVLGEN